MKLARLFGVLGWLAVPAMVGAQSFYMVSKNQFFVQTSASAVAADPVAPFSFRAKALTSVSLTLPSGSTVALDSNSRDGGFIHNRIFSSKAALDAAYPDGTYRMTGSGIPTLSLSVGPDNYPSDTPQVTSATNGTWNSSGMLVVNPTQSTTLNFNTFTGYATSGFAGHINFNLVGMNDNVDLEQDVASKAFLGAPATTTPLTSFTIPAGTLTSGRVYRAWLDYDTATSMDQAIVAGSAVGTLYGKEVLFYIAAQSSGTSTLPPVIVSQPASRSGALGSSVTFSVGVTIGGANWNTTGVQTSFSWWCNGQELDPYSSGGKYSSNGDSLTVNSLTANDAGNYSVVVVTAGGVAISSYATLGFGAQVSPSITAQPLGATVNAGTTVALTVAATGSPLPSFQWSKNGVAITGATADTLVLSNVDATSAGNYTVLVSNSAGSILSNVAAVVVTSGQPSRLPNLSVRTNLAGGEILFVGFVSNGPKNMLVRGIGPTLASYGLTGVLPDPIIGLYNSSAVMINSNNDWDPALGTVFSSVGAFPLTGGSKDAALRQTCSGPHTAQIHSTGSGVVLVEVYDTGDTGKLVNVSARCAVGTGDNVLIAGFVVDGTAAKTLLIRGVGAKLAEYGVTGVLADPKLAIYNSSSIKIAENDSWSPLLQTVARNVGAFDLTLGSSDAALLLTLAPGVYTAQVSGVGGTTGVALVEVYEVP